MPIISVIVPVYKVEPYLRQCVDSILAQTFTDFELILVDDGSPDNCGAICDSYAEQDARVRVIHQENGGLSAARNTGIEAAQGDYLTFVDSDDWVDGHYLHYLYLAVEKAGTRASACGFVRARGNEIVHADELSYSVWDGLGWYRENHIVGVVAWGKLFDKALFRAIRFPVGKIHEDEYTTYKLLYAAGNVAIVRADLYFYYINEAGIIRSAYSIRRLDGLKAIEEQCVFFEKIQRKDMVDFARLRFIEASCSHILKLQQLENAYPYLSKTRRKLQMRLMQWGPSLGMTPMKNRWEFSIAFPSLYHSYIWIREIFKK